MTYVVNRNINFTNVCFTGCRFCAFAHRKERRASPLRRRGAGQVAGRRRPRRHRGVHAGRHRPGDADAFGYRDLLLAIKAAYPTMHMHAFSPMEIMYGARRTGMNYGEYLTMLTRGGPGHDAGHRGGDPRRRRARDPAATRRSTCAPGWRSSPPRTRSASDQLDDDVRPRRDAGARRPPHRMLRDIQQRDAAASPSSCRCASSTRDTELYQKGLVTPAAGACYDLRVYAVHAA